MKNVVREYLLSSYKENKDAVIDAYIGLYADKFIKATYTKGLIAIVDLNENKAYTRGGLLHKVILKDEEYLSNVWEEKGNTILVELLNLAIGDKFSYLDESEEDEDEEAE